MICALPSCVDQVKNGDETDVDCGGSCPSRCNDYQGCSVAADCQSGKCDKQSCVAPSCSDNIKNGTETDIDCGGNCPAKCQNQQGCNIASDCISSICTQKQCVASTCLDAMVDVDETDVDCGGLNCIACTNGKQCLQDRDCKSKVCFGNQCLPTPVLSNVTPSLGPTNSITAVTINGQNFFAGTGLSALFGMSAAQNLMFGSATTLTANVPTRVGSPGVVALSVTFPGNHTYQLANAFRYYFGKLDFSMPASQSQGNMLRAVVAADLTGDNVRDLVLVSQGTNEVLTMKGNGNGTFSAPTKYSVGMAPNHAAVGDWNGDGKLDVAVANGGSGSISILLNNGSGGLTNGTAVTVSAGPEYLLRGDWDGDGKADIAVIHYLSKTITVLRGKGDGTFKPNVDSTNGAMSGRQMARADWNGDGKQDLVVGSEIGNPIALLGDGNGGFTSPVTLSLSQAGSGGVVAGDFDGDGKQDVVAVGAGTNNKITFFAGSGNGSFGSAITTDIPTTLDHRYAEALDLDRDGKLDLLFSSFAAAPGVLHVFRGKGGGRFDPVVALSVSGNPWGFSTADMNGDGKEDLAVAGSLSSKLDVLLSAAQ
jgi:hypothetical protein